MSKSITIMQPTAEEMLRLFDIAKNDITKRVTATLTYTVENLSDIITTTEAKEILGIKHTKFSNLIRNGVIPVEYNQNKVNHFSRAKLIQLQSDGLI